MFVLIGFRSIRFMQLADGIEPHNPPTEYKCVEFRKTLYRIVLIFKKIAQKPHYTHICFSICLYSECSTTRGLAPLPIKHLRRGDMHDAPRIADWRCSIESNFSILKAAPPPNGPINMLRHLFIHTRTHHIRDHNVLCVCMCGSPENLYWFL